MNRSFAVMNNNEQDVLFTNCDSDFDTTLYLYNAYSYEIQDESTNYCDGDDCEDDTSYSCSSGNKETFKMSSLSTGTYKVVLAPFSSGSGNWALEVQCGNNIGNSLWDSFSWNWIWYIIIGLCIASALYKHYCKKKRRAVQSNPELPENGQMQSNTSTSISNTTASATAPAAVGSVQYVQQPVMVQYVVQPVPHHAVNTS